jgi:hypothetical protein
MEVEKMAPIATSPLDSARGRGKTRISAPKRRKERQCRNICDNDIPMVVVLYIPEIKK